MINAEPNQRYKNVLTDILIDGNLTIKQQQQMLKDFKFENFLDYGKRWMKSMKMEWLISGHLTKDDAMNIVNFAEKVIDYKPISEADVNFAHSIELKEKTIYSYD